MMRENTEIFFRKVLLAYRSLQNVLEACIGGGGGPNVPYPLK